MSEVFLTREETNTKCPVCGYNESDWRCPDCGTLVIVRANTVFHQITASPEVLAEKLTYWQYDPNQARCGWTNNIIVGELYKNYHEAIAATVAKLKEVAE